VHGRAIPLADIPDRSRTRHPQKDRDILPRPTQKPVLSVTSLFPLGHVPSVPEAYRQADMYTGWIPHGMRIGWITSFCRKQGHTPKNFVSTMSFFGWLLRKDNSKKICACDGAANRSNDERS